MQSQQKLISDVAEILNETPDLNAKEICRILNFPYNAKSQQYITIQGVIKSYKKIPLKYSSHKKGSKIIKQITPTLKKLVDEKELDYDKDHNIVLLTEENAKKIEATINEDFSYYPFAYTLFKYFEKEKVIKNTDQALEVVMRQIDTDNSTNVWRYKTNRDSFYKLRDYILNDENNFFYELEAGMSDLPDKISKNIEGVNSFSSKICKYLSEYIYKKDNYYINDKYIRQALLFYLDYYEVKHNFKYGTEINNLSYKDLFGYLNKLHTARDKKETGTITKNELDHIIWYCYKSFYAG